MSNHKIKFKLKIGPRFKVGDVVKINKELYDDVRNVLYGGVCGRIDFIKYQDLKWYLFVCTEKFEHNKVERNFEEWFEETEVHLLIPGINDGTEYCPCCPG